MKPAGPAQAPARRPAPSKSCYDQAVALLAQRSHFEGELRVKLTRRGHSATETRDVLERLRRQGYLDDRRTAEEWLGVRRRRGDGPRRLTAGLVRLGVARAIIAELLPAEGGVGEIATARELAERWIARQTSRSGPLDPRALARHLDRRGFGRRAILSVLDELQLSARDVLSQGPEEADEADEADRAGAG
jgi:regulatory protein